MRHFTLTILVFALLLMVDPLAGQAPDLSISDRISRVDPSDYTLRESVHAGAGPMNYGRLVDRPGSPETNLLFVSRGVIEPGGGIGHHVHNASEEMFIILDGEAEFTINGRTSLIQAPAGAPNVMGSSHAIYNPTDRPVEWMNINVTLERGAYDTFDLNDPRVGVELDPIPVFMVMRLDRDLLRPIEALHGGEGTALYRRALEPTVFRSAWGYVDHLVIPPGASAGFHLHPGVAEFHYVMAGDGAITVISGESGESERSSAPISAGDAFEIRIGEIHAIQNTGGEPLELMISGIAPDLDRDLSVIDVPLD